MLLPLLLNNLMTPDGEIPNINQGRMEFTVPFSLTCFTVENDAMEFTLPRSADEFGVSEP